MDVSVALRELLLMLPWAGGGFLVGVFVGVGLRARQHGRHTIWHRT